MNNLTDIPGYKGLYGITRDGKVYSYPKDAIVGCNSHSGKYLTLRLDKYGYLRAYLTLDGETKAKIVSRLVAQTYIPNPDNLPVVNHKDGNKLNNTVENLEWTTIKGNNHHCTRVLKLRIGEDAGKSKLTEKEVLEIRSAFIPDKNKGLFYNNLAAKYGIHPSHLKCILYRLTWKHI